MARATVDIDVRALRSVVEALIFASDEPLPPRVLVRLLAGEREDSRAVDSTDGDESMPASSTIEFVGEEIVDDDADPSRDKDDEVKSDDGEQTGADTIVDESITPTESPAELADVYVDLNRHFPRSVLLDEPVQAIDGRLVRRLVDELNGEYEETGRAFRIVEVAGGFQFATMRDFGEHVALLSKEKLRRRLSPAALETLAILAFRQPISKPEIEAIRGVNSDQVLLSLLEKNLVCITGRSETVGRPLLYGTTDDFLRIFGLNSLNDLPKLREIEELMEDNAYSAERIEIVNVSPSSNAEEIEAMVGAAGHSDVDESHVSISRTNLIAGASSHDREVASEPNVDSSIEDALGNDDGDERSREAELASDEEPFRAVVSDYNDGSDSSSEDNDEPVDPDALFDSGSGDSDDSGLTTDNEAHALEEIDALETGDDSFDGGDELPRGHA